MLALACVAGEPLGTIAPVDPDGDAGEHDLVAHEHTANLLALELTRQRSVADTEQRLWVDHPDELLAGQHLEGILDRFRAMGYDSTAPTVWSSSRSRHAGATGDVSFQAVRRADRGTPVGSVPVARNSRLAVLAERVGD